MSTLSVSVYTASRAKNNFGELLDAAQRKPVAIEKHGRPIAYVVSAKEMEAIGDAVSEKDVLRWSREARKLHRAGALPKLA
jgi:prevent-host-death family protein